MFDIIGLDWGEKYFGLALLSTKTGLILPYTGQIKSYQILDVLNGQVSKNPIKLVILGRPLNFSGENILNSQKVDNFVKKLEDLFPSLQIRTFDERNTSLEAEKSLKKLGNSNKEGVHHLAAMKILEKYLEKENLTK